MRGVFAALILAAALWQGWTDWQATIGAGYAYRLTSIGGALRRAAPERYEALVAAGETGGAGWLWDPVATGVLAAPLAPALAALAAAIWVTRRRRRG